MTKEFIDVELGMGFGLDDSDWGLFIILDEEEKQLSYTKMMKNIIQIETIQECEYENEESYGEKIEYYNPDMKRNDMKRNDVDTDAETKQEFIKEFDDDDDEKNDADNTLVKLKIQSFITYALTTSFSIVLIVLTFTI